MNSAKVINTPVDCNKYVAIKNSIISHYDLSLATIDTILYLEYMISSGRYTHEDIINWDYMANLSSDTRTIDRVSYILMAYKNLNIKKMMLILKISLTNILIGSMCC